jgi:hypothetical protein
MLALEPKAQISSSVEVNPGGGSLTGHLDLEPFVSQRAAFEEVHAFLAGTPVLSVTYIDLLADLKARSSLLIDKRITEGFVRVDPLDSTKFQILRKLHIVYPADGKDVMTLRKGGRLPIVVLTHGNHKYIDGSGNHVPSHRGYDYLQKELASYGILSVGVDMNVANAFDSYVQMRAESTLGALDYMRELDADPASRFYQRLDFDNVGLMGHSRGGDGVAKAALLNAANPASIRYGIKAVCSLAPTDSTGTTAFKNSLGAETPFYAVIYGALDGDVAGFGGASGGTGTGFRHYDRARTQKAMVFLDECNHNRFNEFWTTDDSLAVDIGRLRKREEHYQLVNDYVGGLFRWRLLGKVKSRSLFDGTAPNSLNAPASLQWSFGQKVFSLDEFTLGSSGTALAPPGGSRVLPSTATVKAIGVAISDRTNHQTDVLDLPPGMAATPVAYKLTLAASAQDWSQYDLLIFRVCADADVSASASVGLSALPNFTLVFADDKGNSVEIAAGSLPTLKQPRRPVFHQATNPSTGVIENCTVVRLETLTVDLARLAKLPPAGVDLARMLSISVVPPTVTFLKDQFFDSFELVKR